MTYQYDRRIMAGKVINLRLDALDTYKKAEHTKKVFGDKSSAYSEAFSKYAAAWQAYTQADIDLFEFEAKHFGE